MPRYNKRKYSHYNDDDNAYGGYNNSSRDNSHHRNFHSYSNNYQPHQNHHNHYNGDRNNGYYSSNNDHHHPHSSTHQSHSHYERPTTGYNKRRRVDYYDNAPSSSYSNHRYHHGYQYQNNGYHYSHRRDSRGYSGHSDHSSNGHSHSSTYYDDKDGHYNFKIGEYMQQRYKIEGFMGEGTFAKVVGCWDKDKHSHVAVKIVRAIPKYTEAAEIEIDILRDIGGKNGCIELLDNFEYRKHMCLVFPKYGSSLFDFLKRNRYRGFSMKQLQQLGQHLLQTLRYLHDEKHLIHTDLKPENILLVDSGYTVDEVSRLRIPKNTDIRVIDFGSATYEDQHHTSIISTRHYRAPEVILGMYSKNYTTAWTFQEKCDNYSGLGWSYPADIWSVGCILVELYTGEAIFQTHENREHLAMMDKILGPLPSSMARDCDENSQKYFTRDGALNWPKIASSRSSEDYVAKLQSLEAICGRHKDSQHEKFYQFIRRLLKYEPRERLTAAEALNDAFFT